VTPQFLLRRNVLCFGTPDRSALADHEYRVMLEKFVQQFRHRPTADSPWVNPDPIRGELFHSQRFHEHARSLANAQFVTDKKVSNYLLSDRLDDNAACLREVYRAIAKAVDDGHAITPAAVWLLDNYYLIERQVRKVRSDLPVSYYRQLPKLASGSLEGYPRVLGVVWAFVAHTDSLFEPDILCGYIRAYQEVQPLTIGELWAVAITLRVILIENLRRIAARIKGSREARRDADILADRLLGLGRLTAEPVDKVLADYERPNRSSTTATDAFAVQLIHRLRDQDVTFNVVLTWLDKRLAARGTTADSVVHDEHQRQGTATVTVRNIITSFRLIADVDWTALFERMSPVDDILTANSNFAGMDFPTRNLYRSAIEELTRGSKHSELTIAERAVRLAQAAAGKNTSGLECREADPGHYLIGAGRATFERMVNCKSSLREWIWRIYQSMGVLGYAATVAMAELILLIIPLYGLAALHLDTGWIIVLGILGAIPATDAAVAFVNWAMLRAIGPRPLPALDIIENVPASLRTMVVVPTLLFSENDVDELIQTLEIHYLASIGGDVHYALLTDWRDASSAETPNDAAVLARASEGVARLNSQYGPAPGGARFYLFHRRRVWVESEKRWMGWERKRGKLHELNRLLRGATDTTFISIDGESVVAPQNIKYIITLDSDTKLPRDSVRRLIGKMAHPLNRPRFDPERARVVEGYAIMQPRVTPSLPVGREGSLFRRIFSSMSGIDPYASAVSDIYQDLYGEGSYTGKGIYDLDVFEAALSQRIPDSHLLSHDLFEGVFARAGLASDVEVVDDFPSHYDVASQRNHRWARGDWQLIPWIFDWESIIQRVPAAQRALPEIGRWKMLDNLRRTLSAPAAVLSLVLSWTLPVQAAVLWTVFVLAAIVLPIFVPLIAAFAPRRHGISWNSRFRALASDVYASGMLVVLLITFLADQAWSMADAILRTLYRTFVTRRNMLEWTPVAYLAIGSTFSFLGFYKRMYGAVVIGALALTMTILHTHTWALSLPFALLWLTSPLIARQTSLTPENADTPKVSEFETRELRLIARRTWRFFETFVTPVDNMLPPDNFQEAPAAVVAHRTSPTNIGLYLLSVVTARDFGWVGLSDAVVRLEATFETMNRMARFRGHFYNWYDTRDLRPLDPHYVSSVDSGNLAGHLIAIANSCRDWRTVPFSDSERIRGFEDALAFVSQEAALFGRSQRGQTVTRHHFDHALAEIEGVLTKACQDGMTPSFEEMAHQAEAIADIARVLSAEKNNESASDLLFWVEAARDAAASHQRDLNINQSSTSYAALMDRLTALESKAREIALRMEFGFLFDEDRKLLSIGYLPAQGVLDISCYDLLASEARLASFFAIAKGDIPSRHWLLLGRSVTPVDYAAALISWSGSMFEYLMPSLVMRDPAGSLIERTNNLIVHRQMDYADTLGVPWGISESAYNIRDRELTYQYMNFGVPGLGFKRGLEDNVVIAPYATALAAMVDPSGAFDNFKRLTDVGARGRYGFYEALDYTPMRLPEGEKVAIVKAFMAHHQGMSIVAIANALLNGLLRKRFHAEPIIQATELLLQERTPREVAIARPWEAEVASAVAIKHIELAANRHFTTAHTPTPATHLLSNGHYAVMLTAAGSGYSKWRDMAVTRWRDDSTCDDHGSYIFLRDVVSGEVWSASHQPTGIRPDSYEVSFDEDHVEFMRRDGELTTTMEIVVSPESDTEVRRVTIANFGTETREIDITSYAELVLAPHAADLAHPAFLKLFVETTYLEGVGGLMATRRRRTPNEPEIWAAHIAVGADETSQGVQFETDRARFIGRGRDIRSPIAITDGAPLSNTVGTVLDPIFALRRRVRVAPGENVRVAFWTAVAPSREELMAFIDKRHDTPVFERTATLAWTQARVQLHHIGIEPAEAGIFQALASYLIYPSAALRPSSEAIRRGGGPQSGLWSQGISGDLPIILLRIADIEYLEVARQLVHAHAYWGLKQLAVDLVIINERTSSYVQDLQIALEAMARRSQSRSLANEYGKTGRIFVLRADLMADETRALLVSVARVVLSGQGGRLAEQLSRLSDARVPIGALPTRRNAATENPYTPARPSLEFFNGLGGFDDNGREYVTVLGPGQTTPAPWLNVISNRHFGFQVTAEGAGYTWSINSRENQLTPWSNDPVSDPTGEAFYLHDDDSGDVWCPTARPIRDLAGTYTARHGWGYSRFTHTSHEVESDLIQFVPVDDPIKISRLTLRNTSSRKRKISVTAYVEWVLGRARMATTPVIRTHLDPDTRAIFATNPWSADFGERVAFADLSGTQTDWTCDRRSFIGRNGALAYPRAVLSNAVLSKATGASLDPCAALRTIVTIPPNSSVDVVFLLGQTDSSEDAQRLIKRYRTDEQFSAQNEVVQYWRDFLGAVEVKTPDRSMDIMLNGWLMYQTLVCRVWARSGFYQSSGAYGFRDQLQDGMSLASMKPALTREHLLRAAARQFPEGDVQHWWLPHSGQGVRTRISDDRPWLAYTVAQYIDVTGDAAILDESVSFLEGRKLTEGEHDAFFLPDQANEAASLFEHCARALDDSLTIGSHGLPLIGTGDWNDGMNRVGEKGKGESVWLAWLLHSALSGFASIAEARGELTRAETWRAHATALQIAVENEAWDGAWYRRGYFDDGTPLGSALNDECRIDSIAQSWAVISGAADPARAREGMAAAGRELVRQNDGIAVLFAPPFNRTSLDPGYIKGYPPGIRENGGQYTHAALWSVIALAQLGQGDRAAALFAMLNPINHARTRADVFRYKVEPYVVAADIYAKPPHVGRGGWTWYTGSAGWMQRAGIEAILGVEVRDGALYINACIPKAWPQYEIKIRHKSSWYKIVVENPNGVERGIAAATQDGMPVDSAPLRITLLDDGRTHNISVQLG